MGGPAGFYAITPKRIAASSVNIVQRMTIGFPSNHHINVGASWGSFLGRLLFGPVGDGVDLDAEAFEG